MTRWMSQVRVLSCPPDMQENGRSALRAHRYDCHVTFPRRRVVRFVAIALVVLVPGYTLAVSPAGAASATVVVSSSVIGTSPVLGYNIAHGMEGSNAADWWRYDGAKAARVFLSVSDIEPTDDISGIGDGVNSKTTFENRRGGLRNNASSRVASLDSQFVDWQKFLAAYSQIATGNNRFAVASWFPMLRSQGVDILVNITASPSRFPVSGATDFANMWELWQHFYAQAFLLSRDYGVERFSIFNEPNNWSPAISVENWSLRLRIAADAIRSAVTDMNNRYERSLAPKIYAPNTANGATKYDDYAGGDYWGRQGVLERQQDLWGTGATAGNVNFDVYNYQKYSMEPSTYAVDYDTLIGKITSDIPGGLSMALTEYNVRTGSEYDTRTNTGDSPSDFSALGASSVVLAAKGVSELYLFKYGMTERTGGTYPVAKNGTHYVQNATAGVNNYGGAAGTAEVYRLFLEASGQRRAILGVTSTLGAGVSIQATRDDVDDVVHIFVANTTTSTANVDIDVAALGIPDGSLVTVKEVSANSRGGIVRQSVVSAGRVPAAAMSGQSVWLVSIHSTLSVARDIAVQADATLGDGSLRSISNGSSSVLEVRADGTATGRKLALLRFAVPTTWTTGQRVLLSLPLSASAGSAVVQGHVYGITSDSWSEPSVTFALMNTVLRQRVGNGNTIGFNVITGQGTAAKILGQVMASGTTVNERLIDVTEFVKSQTDGFASFLVTQDHRWDTKLPERTIGDTQSAGLRIASREAGPGSKLRILERPGVTAGLPTFSPLGGTYASAQSVSLSSSTPGAIIRYSTDGSTPSSATGIIYSGPFTVSSTMTVRAIATLSGTVDSSVASATYNIVPPTSSTFSAEFESIPVAGSSGDRRGTRNDSGASGGKSVLYRANSVGDFITFALSVPAAGTYSVSMLAKMESDRGVIQLEYGLSANGPWTSIDSPKDQYRPLITFGSIGTFLNSVTFPQGTVYLRLRVTDRNGASSGFFVNADRITFSN